MKSPPIQYSDEQARQKTEAFIAGQLPRSKAGQAARLGARADSSHPGLRVLKHLQLGRRLAWLKVCT